MANYKKGLPSVIAAASIQFVFGLAYIWSVFQTGVAESVFGGDNAAAALTFSLTLAMLGVGSMIGGKLSAKLSTRAVVFTGGIILSAGFLIASFVTADVPWLLWLTYGIMGGVGMGFTYSPSISCAQKWYPHKKGLVTGIIVAALGVGGAAFTPFVEWLIDVFGGAGVGEAQTFLVLSAILFVVCSVGSLFLKTPPDGYAAADAATTARRPEDETTVSLTTAQMVRTPQFFLAAGALLLACMSGLMMIGFAKPIAVARGLGETAAIGVLAISLFNSLGRLFWGMVSDKLGRINTLFILLTGTAALSLLVNAAVGYWIYVLIAMIGFFYGGIIGIYPSLTTDLFGSKYMAVNYGVVLLGFSAGAVISSQVAGYYRDVAASDIGLMFPAFVIAACCSAAGVGLIWLLRVTEKKRLSDAPAPRRH